MHRSKELPKSALRLLASAEGKAERFHYDEVEDTVTIETVQDVTPILKANEIMRNSGEDGYSASRNMRRVAQIPMVIVDELYRQGINIFDQNDWPKWAHKLDDPDWAKFRTAPGRVSRRPYREFVQVKEGWQKR